PFFLLGISADGKSIYTDSWATTQLKIWDASSGQVRLTEPSPSEEARIITLSPDKTLMATESQKTGLIVRSLQNHQIVRSFSDYANHFTLEANTVGFSHDNHTLAIADSFGGMRLYDLPSGKRLASPIDDMKNEGQAIRDVAVHSFQFSADDHYLFVSKP